MRYSKINYVVVGAFVLAMLVAAIASVAILTGRTGAVDRYFTIYDNVTGVKFGTQVIYEGYPIGQVENVLPEERNGRMEFRVDFSITQGWRIPEDSQIEIAAPSLLSSVALQVHAGVSTDSLTPGDRVNSRDASSVFGAVSSLADQVAQVIETDAKPLFAEVTATFKELNRFIDEDGNILARDMQALVRDLQGRIPGIADNIEDFTVNMSKASQEVGRIASPKNRELIEGILQQMDGATKKFDDVLITMDKVLEDVDRLAVDPKADVEIILGETRYVVESVSRHIDSINQNMESAARNMNEFSRQIRANPGLLLGSAPPSNANAQ